MALYLAERGYDVAIHYHSSHDAAQDTVAAITAKGQNACAIRADLLETGAAARVFNEARSHLGGDITCLINNASVFEYDRIGMVTDEGFDRHLASNLKAPLMLIQEMAAQGLTATPDAAGEPIARGTVINMIDQRVRKLTPEFMSYTLAKSALWTLTQTAAQALAPHIRVNGIGPGPTVIGHRQSSAHFKGQRENTVLKRGSNPDDILAALGYFLDAPAVTGQLICADGGQHLGWETPDIRGVEL